MPMPKKPRANCLACSQETGRFGYKYCSNKCQKAYEHNAYIEKWKKGEVSGLQLGMATVSSYVKRYLREKYDNKCCMCGWSEINPYSKIVPLVADHIDGDWTNNTEKNLRLLCPNCDSLTATYAGLNKGRGRKNRVVSQRVKRGRALRIKPM